ncbi:MULTISPECIES: hypothetical protein [Bacillus cereus group]|uniref:Uncharacterized protein n=1 Tax=Bacillus thuringiensis TaxID=1428 RepID=A0A9X6WH43_BACTU|nr:MULTISPECIES: hypothetical protein [Bacillus cereus group]PFJ25898.1 hypothetical protein COJ15_35360 [Bacillus thuringiensis]PGP14693.1 hypothetical protein COA01_30540 [Bacillus cereus]
MLITTRSESTVPKKKVSVLRKFQALFGKKNPERDFADEAIHKNLSEVANVDNADKRKKEILKFSKDLQPFGLNFSSMVNEKPRKEKDIHLALSIAKSITENKHMKEKLFLQRSIPVLEVTSNISVKESFLVKNEAYIIGLTILLTGEYKLLKEYWVEGILH